MANAATTEQVLLTTTVSLEPAARLTGLRSIQKLNKGMHSHRRGYAVKKRIIEVITRRYPPHSGGERRESICPFGIPITNMSEDHVQEILDGKSKEYGEIPEASEEKAALKPFLNPPLGYTRTYFVHSPIMNENSS
jgi:hypothetical protein